MKAWLDDHFDIPDKTVAVLIRFLDQNNGELSNRARTREFSVLEEDEVELIEKQYRSVSVDNLNEYPASFLKIMLGGDN